MKFQRLISLCCLLAFSTLCAPVSAHAAAPKIDYYKGVTKDWSTDTIVTVMQCEIPSSMKLTEAEKDIYRVGFGEGYDYGYETFVTGTMEQLAQEGLTPPNATQIFAQYKTDTFSILLPMTWNVGTRTSYQQNDQELERIFADYFIDYSDMVLIGSTPWGGMIHITQDKDFSYAPFMAKFTNDEIQLSEYAFSKIEQQYAIGESLELKNMSFTSLNCSQATFLICNAIMDYTDSGTDADAYLLSAYLLTNPGSDPSYFDFYIDYVSDYAFTEEDIAQFQDILLSIHFEENVLFS